MRLAVLVSGSGTILRAMFDAGLPVTTVLSDRPCEALALARAHGAADELVDRRAYGVTIAVCPPRRAQRKGVVEAAVPAALLVAKRRRAK